MKKLEKLKEQKAKKFNFNGNLSVLKNNKYIIFKYKEDDIFIWKFIKTEKILKIENNKIFTNVNGNEYLSDGEFYVTNEFTIAKMTCDKNNKENKIL